MANAQFPPFPPYPPEVLRAASTEPNIRQAFDVALRDYADAATQDIRRQLEIAQAERDAARAQRERAVAILSRVYGLLYPAPIKVDGRELVFRPPTLGDDMQRLCDAIRAIPDELDAVVANERAEAAEAERDKLLATLRDIDESCRYVEDYEAAVDSIRAAVKAALRNAPPSPRS